jgi:hypothetical protein
MSDVPPRTYRLVTSLTRIGDTKNGFGGVRKHVDLAPGEKRRLCRLEGRGRIVRIWMTLPGGAAALTGAVLRMYWDGEEDPSVEAPLGAFFGATFGKARPFVSEKMIIAGGGYLCRFEMPFHDGAILELQNDSMKPLRNVFFQIGYYEEPDRTDREPTFHASYRRENPTRSDAPFVALEARGAGYLAGLRMDVQNRSWWLKPPVREIILPRGLGLGVMEGWETIVVDEDSTPIRGTGLEDYFSGGFYFQGGPFSTPTHGCTRRSFFAGRMSAYRFHENDRIFFRRSLDLRIDHGVNNGMQADMSSVAYWYQTEPHHPLPPLPASRRARVPWVNVAQWTLVAAVFAAAVELALRAVR